MTRKRSALMRCVAWGVGAIAVAVLTAGCAATQEPRADAQADQQRASESRATPVAKVAADPRPIGVPDDATPEERGREVLRVIVELIKRRDFRDTEFASRLLRLPIEKDKGIFLHTPDLFPQQLVNYFGYSAGEFHLGVIVAPEPSRTCVSVADLLDIFHRELGIEPTMTNDRPRYGVRRLQLPPTAGWYVSLGHTDLSDRKFVYRPLVDFGQVDFFVRHDAMCILQLTVSDRNRNRPR